MEILVVGLVKNEQLDRVRDEAEKRGHTVDGCYTTELVTHVSKDGFAPTLRGKQMDSYDLIYLWTVGKRRWEWYTAALYLHEKFGTIIVNEKSIASDYHFFLTPAIDYLKQVKEDLPFPRSCVFFDTKSVKSAVEGFDFPAILKISGGRQGKGVFKINSINEIKKIIDEHDEAQSFDLREFIPNDGDIRVFTVGYKAIGAMKRTPKEGDFRSNISQGGGGEKFDLSKRPDVQKIAERVSLVMRTEIAGVDIMLHSETGEPYILEINPGPQFTGLEKFTKTNAALEIVKYFEKLQKEK